MPSFDTPEPVSVTAHVSAGSIRYTASDRPDTLVDVHPRDPDKDQDVRAAEQTEVTYANGTLTIRTPRQRYVIARTGTVDVSVALPTGSHTDTTGSWTQVLAEGRLGETRVKTSTGDVHLDATGPLHLTASHGPVTINHIQGPAEITTSSGSLRIGTIDGPAVLKNSHGTTTVHTVTGELRVNGANGDIDIEHATNSLTATTAHGTLRVNHATRGTLQLHTSHGAIDIGIHHDTATWIDAHSEHGQVHNTLATTQPPHTTDDTLEIHARTRYGNINIHRAQP
ncbi:DUF4097 family beta strand repeat-containing protein [Streptomyces sp. NPDC002514]|uniref:DUF4097 family beta strand repeat-containing protein n=1 Tax=Streptomyces sp. NPDC001270 TaxID=3364554 RepID=UPI0036BF2363